MSSLTMMPMSLEEIAQAVQGRLIAGTAGSEYAGGHQRIHRFTADR